MEYQVYVHSPEIAYSSKWQMLLRCRQYYSLN
nr:MAG TPA: hypothetical protein [Bacteriophage sp.]